MHKDKNYYYNLVLIFFITSPIGYLIENTLLFFQHFKLEMKGPLILPLMPIYGIGSILIIIFFYKEKNKILRFMKCSLLLSFFEYMSSYLIELIFHKKYWDYSDKFLNLNGRICLINSLLFGLFGYLLLTYLYPFLTNKFNKIEFKNKKMLCYILIIIFIIDYIVSTFILKKS